MSAVGRPSGDMPEAAPSATSLGAAGDLVPEVASAALPLETAGDLVPEAATTASTGPGAAADPAPAPPSIDPRAVRVSVAPTSRLGDDPTIVVAPPPVAVEPPRATLAGVGILGGVPAETMSRPDPDPAAEPDRPLVAGTAVAARLEWLDGSRAVLVRGGGPTETRMRVVLGPAGGRDGTVLREVVADGWRIDLELRSERRAALRERSRRGSASGSHAGPLEVHAIIPGRIVAISAAPGDAVTAGQVLLVLEAMKMQNELRAPREGTVERVAVGVGSTVEVGDLLMVIS